MICYPEVVDIEPTACLRLPRTIAKEAHFGTYPLALGSQELVGYNN